MVSTLDLKLSILSDREAASLVKKRFLLIGSATDIAVDDEDGDDDGDDDDDEENNSSRSTRVFGNNLCNSSYKTLFLDKTSSMMDSSIP